MAEFDLFLTVIWPLLGGGLITFIAMGIKGGLKMGSSQVTGSVKIEGLEERLVKVENKVEITVKDVETVVKDAVKELERGIEKRDESLKNELTRMWERIANNTADIKLHEYRLNEVQNNKRKGGDRSPI